MPKSNMSWGQAPSHGQNTHVQGQAPDRGLAETTESDMARGQAPSHGWNTHVQGQPGQVGAGHALGDGCLS